MNILVVISLPEAMIRIQKELRNYPKLIPTYVTTFKETTELLKDSSLTFHAALASLKLSDAGNGEIVSLLNLSKISSILVTEQISGAKRTKIIQKSIIDVIQNDITNCTYIAVKALHKITTNYEKTVLIVDDSKTYRASVKKSLEQLHFKVLEAENGQEALDIIEKSPFIKLVITDNEMPVMNGLDLTYKLRQNHNKDELAIIVISTVDEKEVVNNFLSLGANDYLHKPFSHKELMIRVDTNLDLLSLFTTMRDAANKDFLSGMYNRRYFFDSGEAIYSKNQRKNLPLCVAMIDIDNFKAINDTHGHDVGDEAIKEVARILDTNCRTSDLIARFGGEEFCILLDDISQSDSEKLFEKIRKAFEENVIKINGLEISYTVSTGISYGFTSSLDDMIKESDEALYTAKTTGKNKVCFFE